MRERKIYLATTLHIQVDLGSRVYRRRCYQDVIVLPHDLPDAEVLSDGSKYTLGITTKFTGVWAYCSTFTFILSLHLYPQHPPLSLP